jgi:hypothetical protein
MPIGGGSAASPVSLTPPLARFGTALTVPFSQSATLAESDIVRGNLARRTTNYSIDRAKVTGRLLTTISATDVATLTPWGRGQYLVSVSYRVVTVVTDVTVAVSFTNDAGAQTKTLLATTSKAVGTYTDLIPILVEALSSAAVKVTVTAGTADQVFMSASITEQSSAARRCSPHPRHRRWGDPVTLAGPD